LKNKTKKPEIPEKKGRKPEREKQGPVKGEKKEKNNGNRPEKDGFCLI